MNISEITRRDIIDFLLLREIPFFGRLDLVTFLKRIWNLKSMDSTDSRYSNAEGDIWQHMINNDDWNFEYLLCTYLELLTCEEKIFLSFLQQTLHPLVITDKRIIAESVKVYNSKLAPDGYRFEIGSYVSDRPIYNAKRIEAKNFSPNERIYEVVLSFAGENRNYVERVAEFLKSHEVNLFYDVFEEVTLWGKDLAEHLEKVYGGNARYCVMFISKFFAEKMWPTQERRIAFAKAIEEKEEYILPARFDQTKIPGLRSSIGYIDISNKEPEELGSLILSKLGRVQ
jgi:hypothetical protein